MKIDTLGWNVIGVERVERVKMRISSWRLGLSWNQSSRALSGQGIVVLET